MRRVVLACLLGGLGCFVPYLAHAQSDAGASPALAQGTHQSAVSKPPASAGSLCAASERTVFSCVLEGNRKSVSLCASSDLNRFYYTYGRRGALELTFPPKEQPFKNPFMLSNLWLAGGRTGHTYSFASGDFEYIIYSISGRYSFQNVAGLMVRHISDKDQVLQNMSCRKGSVFEPDDDHDVANIVSKWPPEVTIKENGLPPTPY
jgi:hypothetical protein